MYRIGDPGKEQSIAIIKSLIDGGADALELGIPFSDPIADGPVIQKANIRALDVHINTQDCFDIIKEIREYNADIPIGPLISAKAIPTTANRIPMKISELSITPHFAISIPMYSNRNPTAQTINSRRNSFVGMISENEEIKTIVRMEKAPAMVCPAFL